MIYAIVGKTSSGKDTIAKHLSWRWNIPIVCSATTRPMRKYETNGKEHWFVTKEKMAELKNSPHVIAYTKMPYTGIEYAATTDMVNGTVLKEPFPGKGLSPFPLNGTVLKEPFPGANQGFTPLKNKDMIYIINPEGIRWFKENGTKDMPMVSIFVDLPETLIVDRAIKRGDNFSDIMDRLASESKEMNRFRDEKEYDYLIDNSGTLSDSLRRADEIIETICQNQKKEKEQDLER
jgi:guanylate kinase